MAHFAHVIDGTVVAVHVLANAVITDENGSEVEGLGKTFLADLWGTKPDEWVQTSYNGNPINGIDRGPYAGIGYAWDGQRFTPPTAPEEA